MRPGADAEMHIRVRNPESGEEHIGEIGVVVLACVHDDVLMIGTGEGGRDGRQFDQLRPGANDAYDLHGCLPLLGSRAEP
jgi:hypothetical protein